MVRSQGATDRERDLFQIRWDHAQYSRRSRHWRGHRCTHATRRHDHRARLTTRHDLCGFDIERADRHRRRVVERHGHAHVLFGEFRCRGRVVHFSVKHSASGL